MSDDPDNGTDGLDVDFLFVDDDNIAESDCLQPEPVQMYRLWQMFLDRVNPISKVIHVPSVQQSIHEATYGISSLPHEVQALLYSIFSFTVVSLSEAECAQMLNVSCATALRRFTAGARQALKRAKFVRHPNMAILQA